MKILLATMQFGRGYGQGTERYIIMLAEGLRQRGHEVAVLGGDPEQRGLRLPLGEEFEQHPRVLFYPTRGWTSVRGRPASELAPLVEQERPDIVHLVNPGHIGIGLMEAARHAGIPVVVTVVDYWWLCPRHILLHPERGICDANVSWLDCVHCLGAVDARKWVRSLAKLPAARSIVLPILYLVSALSRGSTLGECLSWTRRRRILLDALNAAGAIIFLSDGARARIAPRLNHARTHSIVVGMEERWFKVQPQDPGDGSPRDPARLTLGFVGALAAHKGTHLLLAAVRRLGWTATRVRIAGGGTDTAYLDNLHELARGLNVEFVGRVPTSDMPAFLSGLDLMVVPSTWPENLPQTVLEAQAVGTPVLASRVDGVAEVISDPTMLFDVNSAAGLARCLAGWANNPRTPPPAKAVRRADVMVAETLDVYAAVRSENRGVPDACTTDKNVRL
ncbi:MAG: glycosyltransferase [Phycisphaerae bacterium]|nr:glycosyltransferase [Phycisphaerae bacterium]